MQIADILFSISTYLQARDVMRLSMVSKHHYSICTANNVWYTMVERDYMYLVYLKHDHVDDEWLSMPELIGTEYRKMYYTWKRIVDVLPLDDTEHSVYVTHDFIKLLGYICFMAGWHTTLQLYRLCVKLNVDKDIYILSAFNLAMYWTEYGLQIPTYTFMHKELVNYWYDVHCKESIASVYFDKLADVCAHSIIAIIKNLYRELCTYSHLTPKEEVISVRDRHRHYLSFNVTIPDMFLRLCERDCSIDDILTDNFQSGGCIRDEYVKAYYSLYQIGRGCI